MITGKSDRQPDPFCSKNINAVALDGKLDDYVGRLGRASSSSKRLSLAKAMVEAGEAL
ncbi:hypothetical protein L4C34_00795 [Vibrio profundum]|uniref:hypothetical protein n=1 Tax=Vibrio profundum TaxID=2910247 RepID=UPI003D0E9986